ncbi:MAG: flagellar basal body L-ring protein FlgH, partial [Balneolaceae bacterium]
VQIVDVSPSGDLVVEGVRSTEINGELHEMSLSGVIRPSDVDSRNRVLSYRVANANIRYDKKGGVRGLTKQRGLLRRAIFVGVGAALGAAILLNDM